MMASMLTSSFVGSSATKAAFTPKRANVQRVSVVTRAGLTPGQEYTKTLAGISAPFNSPYFDPAGLATQTSPSDIKRWREAELTHGRVSMLAALGFIVGEQLEDFPAFLNFDGQITGPAILQFQQVEARGAIFWEPLIFAIGIAEAYRVALGWSAPIGTGFNTLKDDYSPGALNFDPLNLKPTNAADFKVMQTKELNNGRLAMIAIAGFVAQESVQPGVEIFEHLFVGGDADVASAL